ncbi:MAG: class I SAM-dependent methyltransferase [Halobacteria archaeon]|nr:class I SAM-dependent methyltransferase [Halobacteria archaeon]
MYYAEENEKLREIVQRIAERSPGKVTSRPIDALLYSVVRARKPDRCLELGAYEGTMSLYIAQGLKDNGEGELTAVEVDEASARGARQHLDEAGLEDYAEVVVADSTEYVPTLDGKFDLVFVDTPPNQYTEDYENVRPLLADDGVLAVDDALSSGNDDLVERMEKDDGMNVLRFHEYRSFVLAQKSELR